MLDKLEKLLDLHANILDKYLLYSVIKDAILFSMDNAIRTEPLLFVGNPGCGKTLLCRQLRELFNQDNDIVIPMGCGSGISGLLGSTPEYRGSSNGKILSAIWNSMEKSNCLNPLVVIDEIEKSCFSTRVNDINQNVFPTLLQLWGNENRLHFMDNFFEVPVTKEFHPNYIATANSLEPIPQPLLDRVNVIRFRDYTENELKNKIIPFQFESYRKNRNKLVPKRLTNDETELIYKMSNGRTRKIQPSINKYLSAIFDINGKKHKLSSAEIENLIESSAVYCEEKQIGFCR